MRVLKQIKVKADVKEKWEEGGSGEPLSPMARVFHQPDTNIYIVAMIGFKTNINPEVIKSNLVHTLLKHPRFSSLPVVDEKVEGGLKWVPTEVDLDNHVVVPELEPNNIDSPEMIVEDYVSNLSKTKIKMSIPMWDLHLLNIKTSYAEAVGVLRIHHSLGDGTSLMSLLLASFRKVSDPMEPPSIPTVRKATSSSKSPGGFLVHCLIKLWLVLSLYWNTFVDVLKLLATMSMVLKDTETPLKRGLVSAATPRRFVHRMVSLDDVKIVKNAMNTTVNDVIMGITQAGLSRYLNRKYGESKIDKGSSEKYNNLPQNIRFRASLAVDLRPSTGIQELADSMRKGLFARWGNQFGFIICPFTIAMRDDPLDYVREAKATMDRKKASLEMVSLPSQVTLYFSNVPGPLEEVSYCGHPVAYIAPSCYGQPCGLLIHVASYVNKMSFVLSVEESVVPDPHRLCDDLVESLYLMKNAVIEKGLA